MKQEKLSSTKVAKAIFQILRKDNPLLYSRDTILLLPLKDDLARVITIYPDIFDKSLVSCSAVYLPLYAGLDSFLLNFSMDIERKSTSATDQEARSWSSSEIAELAEAITLNGLPFLRAAPDASSFARYCKSISSGDSDFADVVSALSDAKAGKMRQARLRLELTAFKYLWQRREAERQKLLPCVQAMRQATISTFLIENADESAKRLKLSDFRKTSV